MQTDPIENSPARRPRSGTYQPIEAAMLPDAHLRIRTVSQITGLSVATLYRLLAKGEFVAPIRRGQRCTRFRAGDVRAWLEAQSASK